MIILEAAARRAQGPAASHSARYLAAVIVIALFVAVPIRLQAVTWLIGVGGTSELSMNIDDNRFIESARDFKNAEAKPGPGYPLFMTTQLFLVSEAADKLAGHHVNRAVVLRGISIAYSALTIVLTFFFCRAIGLGNLVAAIASAFLAAAPLHVLMSHQGTPDISVLFIFYAAILLAILYRKTLDLRLFYGVALLTGIALADKFFLPSLVPMGMLLVVSPPPSPIGRAFLAGWAALAAFCTASFFNYTPWDFTALMRMLATDNLVVGGGKSPVEQLYLYPLDIVSSSGVVASLFALVALVALARRAKPLERPSNAVHLAKRLWAWLASPTALIVMPLLAHSFLIIVAQVHFARHVLVFVPLVCVLAAVGVAQCLQLATSPQVRYAILAFLFLATTFNAYLTNQIYVTDVRRDLVGFLETQRHGIRPTSLNFYTRLRGVAEVETTSELSTLFITCDLEYSRYFRHADADHIFHSFGGQERLDFYRALFAGRTEFRRIDIEQRDRFSLEDRLAGVGWLPELATFVPNRCDVFERYSSEPLPLVTSE